MNGFYKTTGSSHNPREFYGTLKRPMANVEPFRFTVKFRKNSEAWQWINDQWPQEDGEVCFQISTQILGDLTAYLQYPAYGLSLDHVTLDTYTDRQLWSITASIDPARERCSTFRTLKLGFPSKGTRWFSLVRISRPWLGPRHGKGRFSISEDAVLASFLRCDGICLTLLAISVDEVLTVLNSDDQGNVFACARNDSLTHGIIRVLVAVSMTFENGNAALMHYAREVVSKSVPTPSEQVETMMIGSSTDASAKETEQWQNSFTYCTWNGLGQHLDEAMIISALNRLQDCDINITSLIIDDGWQSLDDHGTSSFDRRWMGFDANESNFKQGLKSTVTKIRKANPLIEHIAVWHGIYGYWGGISPFGEVYKRYKSLEARKQTSGLLAGGSIIVVAVEDAFKFYDDFYRYVCQISRVYIIHWQLRFLCDAGITSVKADTQFFIDHLDDASDRRLLNKTYQDAWSQAASKYFGLKVISCMSQIPQILFYSQLPAKNPRFRVRNSDDFFPDEPNSHSWHVFCNAHNSVLMRHLNVLPDWDMFQTNHAYSAFHAAARCVSGGPVYFSDKPGEHNIDLIDEITAKAPLKRTVLRPNVGRTIQIYTGHMERAFCKIGTTSGPKEAGCSILGVFNVGESPLLGFVELKDFLNIQPDQAYVVRAHTSGKISSTFCLEDDAALMLLRLDRWGYEILTAYALQSFTIFSDHPAHHTDVAVLGLLHKMTGAVAVESVQMKLQYNSVRLKIKIILKALGVLGDDFTPSY